MFHGDDRVVMQCVAQITATHEYNKTTLQRIHIWNNVVSQIDLLAAHKCNTETLWSSKRGGGNNPITKIHWLFSFVLPWVFINFVSMVTQKALSFLYFHTKMSSSINLYSLRSPLLSCMPRAVRWAAVNSRCTWRTAVRGHVVLPWLPEEATPRTLPCATCWRVVGGGGESSAPCQVIKIYNYPSDRCSKVLERDTQRQQESQECRDGLYGRRVETPTGSLHSKPQPRQLPFVVLHHMTLTVNYYLLNCASTVSYLDLRVRMPWHKTSSLFIL